MRTLPAFSLWAAALLGACASEAPANTSFDSSAGLVVVDVLGDGFVRSAERRMPLEAFVLELRQRTRRMSREDLKRRFVVQLRADPLPGPEAAARAQQGFERLLHELEVMGVRQVRYL
ncbi:MAG TPA: hypothetical protein VFD82_10465 [Planctomycetota bacterium]|nr:hypothetical protein [Planctomycetota bacterium]